MKIQDTQVSNYGKTSICEPENIATVGNDVQQSEHIDWS